PPPPRPARAPRARRRRRFRIPFKKTILFVLMVLLLLSAADQIASAVNEKREALWNRLVDRVEQQIDEWRGQAGDAVNDVPGQLTDEIGDRINDRPATGGPGPGQAP
ncbi:serine/threonine protein kinase, partial [Frankia sp. CN4]|nr:serine/threonine protein kinase [Frankia nepalensis]